MYWRGMREDLCNGVFFSDANNLGTFFHFSHATDFFFSVRPLTRAFFLSMTPPTQGLFFFTIDSPIF